MKKALLLLLIPFLLISGCKTKQPVDYVDPFIGTGFHGHTYPGATVPYGAVQLSPDTHRNDWDACSGYHYNDSTILGFSHTHLSGTGCGDLGDLLFHPLTEEPVLRSKGDIFDPLPFCHKNEYARAGYYRVKLDNGILAELTATTHTGIHKYSYPEGSDAKLIIDLAHLISDERISEAEFHNKQGEISGMRSTSGWVANHHIYFVALFSEPFEVSYVSNGVKVDSTAEAKGERLQAVLTFSELKGKSVVIKVGVSAVSVENARMNLEAEMKDFDFDRAKDQARMKWNEALSVYNVSGTGEDNLKTFYTSLYHTMLTPNQTSDINGDYRGPDNQIHQGRNNKTYSTLSLWDTFRSWHPLITLTDTTLVNNIINSFLDFYDQSGELPVWPLASGETNCMIGYHSISVIYDAWSKNIRGYDAEKVFEAMKVSADKNNKSTSPYLEAGFIPADVKRESVSCLLENAYDDWCIAQMAKALGHEDDYNRFAERAQIYKNVFDGHSRFFRPRLSDGAWMSPFNSFEAGRAYTEATAWQYRFFVPHDVNSIVNLLGGEKNFIDALDSLFTVESDFSGEQSDITGMIGQYAHGNEPSHHMAYLYCYTGQPWKTQEMTRRILKEMYQPTPEGISGNEDCGQMSAWYVLSSIGLYAVCPGSTQFILTTPLFGKTVIRMASGKGLTITANDPEKNIYIKEVYLNGVALNENYITYSQLMRGGELKFVLDSKPNIDRGISPESYPYSFSNNKEVSLPFITTDLSCFTDEASVVCGTVTEGAKIYYTIDGTEPSESSILYNSPFTIKNSAVIKLKAYKSGMEPSATAHYKATEAEYQPALKISLSKNGINYKAYEGSFSKTSEITSKGKIIDSGTTDIISFAVAKIHDYVGIVFNGYIYAPVDGIYTFSTTSDDGSLLRIGNQTIVNNDGSHSAARSSGRVALRKGMHPFELLYFDGSAEEALSASWMIPGETKEEPIAAEYFFIK